jgi:dihydroorotate dehydrogenase
MIGAPTFGGARDVIDFVYGMDPVVAEDVDYQQIQDQVMRFSPVEPVSPEFDRQVSQWTNALANYREEARRLAFARGFSVPIYDSLQEYADNVRPPFALDEVRPESDPLPSSWTLLNRNVGLPVGLPASVLTRNKAWIEGFANLGYTVFVVKTVRSFEHPGYTGQQNWIFADPQLPPYYPGELGKRLHESVHGDERFWPESLEAFSTLNAFGVPSPDPEVWMKDVHSLAAEIDGNGRLLIVSVVGHYEKLHDEPEKLIEDFVKVAEMAGRAGAMAVELNLSCPNHPPPHNDPICSNPDLTLAIVEAVRDRLPSWIGLIAKVSYLSREEMESVLVPLLPYVDGIAGINTLQVHTDAFAQTDVAGLSGLALRPLTEDFVVQLDALRAEHHASFDIFATGGIMSAEDAAHIYDLGADCVLSASAANFNARLAFDCADLVRTRGAFAPRQSSDHFDRDEIIDEIQSVLKGQKSLTVGQLIARTTYPPEAIQETLAFMKGRGLVDDEGYDDLRGTSYRVAV